MANIEYVKEVIEQHREEYISRRLQHSGVGMQNKGMCLIWPERQRRDAFATEGSHTAESSLASVNTSLAISQSRNEEPAPHYESFVEIG